MAGRRVKMAKRTPYKVDNSPKEPMVSTFEKAFFIYDKDTEFLEKYFCNTANPLHWSNC